MISLVTIAFVCVCVLAGGRFPVVPGRGAETASRAEACSGSAVLRAGGEGYRDC